jgi:hypothetical protein
MQLAGRALAAVARQHGEGAFDLALAFQVAGMLKPRERFHISSHGIIHAAQPLAATFNEGIPRSITINPACSSTVRCTASASLEMVRTTAPIRAAAPSTWEITERSRVTRITVMRFRWRLCRGSRR